MRRLLTLILLIAIIASGADAAKKRTRSKKKTKHRTAKVVIPKDYDGIDVSSYQKDIDWEKVCKDKRIRFVYIKATEGATYTSPHFEYNIENARKHGLKVGSYHFLRTTSTLAEQFENFTKSARPEDQDLVPLIDFENKGTWTNKQICDSLEAFLNMVREYYNCEPMLYTMTTFYNKNLSPHFDKCKLFIARYSSSAPVLNGKAKYTLWQYTDQGRIAGIDHTVDLCRFAKGKKLKDILIPAEAMKLNKQKRKTETHEKPKTDTVTTTVQEQEIELKPDTATTPSVELTKEELKELDKEAKRAKKLREKAVKDSLKMARKLEKARKDSIKKAEKQAIKENRLREASLKEDGKSEKKNSNLKKYYSTRRNKD